MPRGTSKSVKGTPIKKTVMRSSKKKVVEATAAIGPNVETNSGNLTAYKKLLNKVNENKRKRVAETNTHANKVPKAGPSGTKTAKVKSKSQPVTTTKFNEDDNFVAMEVDHDEFLSQSDEDELSDQDQMMVEEGEIIDGLQNNNATVGNLNQLKDVQTER